MTRKEQRVRIITGFNGSGKTEFSVNYAMMLSKTSEKLALADLDIVNAYFRSRERREELAEKGIEVISTSIQEDNVDMPALSGRIYTPLIDKSYDYIIDLGGGEAGANILGRFRPYLQQEETDLMMVVNVFRQETDSVEKILNEKKALEEKTGLRITAFINNSNLIRETRVEDIEYGDSLLKQVQRITGIPVRYTTWMRNQYHKPPCRVSGELFPMDYYMRAAWM